MFAADQGGHNLRFHQVLVLRGSRIQIPAAMGFQIFVNRLSVDEKQLGLILDPHALINRVLVGINLQPGSNGHIFVNAGRIPEHGTFFVRIDLRGTDPAFDGRELIQVFINALHPLHRSSVDHNPASGALFRNNRIHLRVADGTALDPPALLILFILASVLQRLL